MAENTIKETLETVAEYIGEQVNETKEPTFRYKTMPEAGENNLNDVVQYIGVTKDGFKNGYFYKCVAQGTNPETYAWEENATGDGDARIGDEITRIKVRTDDGFRPYISIDVSKAIPAFADCDLSTLRHIVESYYNGTISHEIISSRWSVGDSKEIVIPAIESEYGMGAIAQQTVNLYIADFKHDTLTTQIDDKETALMTLCFEVAENGVLNTARSNSGGWANMPRRTWCNDTCFNAMPQDIQSIIKPVDKTLATVTSDKMFIASSMELTNNTSFYKWDFPIVDKSSGADGGTQYSIYANNDYPFTKAVHSATTCSFKFEYSTSHPSDSFICRSTSGNKWAYANESYGLLIHFGV